MTGMPLFFRTIRVELKIAGATILAVGDNF